MSKDGKQESREEFLSRWSRLKEEARQAPADEAPGKAPETPADPKAPAPELPPLEKLTFDSDYRAFFHPKVGEDVRRAALKKLFSDPHFNVMDGLDVYIDDYSKTEPIPPEMMAGLRQAQKILQWAKEDEEQRRRDELERRGEALPESAASQALGMVSAAPGVPAAPSPSEIGFEQETEEAAPVASPAAGKPTQA